MTEPSKIILVAGMHRSGTSALARVVNLLGADLAADLVPAGIGNEAGHWESRAAQQLHNEMLADAGVDVYSPVSFPAAWFSGRSASAFVDRIVALIENEYRSSSLFVVKDPRLALFVPIWLAALHKMSVQPHFIIPFRDPLAVAASLTLREQRLDPVNALPVSHGLAMWLRYVLAAEKHTRGQLRSFVSFEMLLSDWRREVERIGRQLAIAWPRLGHADPEIDRFLDGAHRVPAPDSDRDGPPDVGPIIRSVYGSLEQAADDPHLLPDTFDAAADAVSVAEEILRAYVRGKEQQAAKLRDLVDRNALQHATDLANAHRAFEREITARDARVSEATAYAKSQEVRANQLDEALRYAAAQTRASGR